MSIYGYLNCHDCQNTIWLGKAIHQDYRPDYFHVGDEGAPFNWQQADLNQAVWKFLADHCAHQIDVRLEQDMSELMMAYKVIGGDSDNDIPMNQYLEDWKGK